MRIRSLLISPPFWCGFLLALGLAGCARSEPADFSLPDLDGKIHHLSDYRGKWVLVNYWATWCPPCREELPELEDFYERHKDKDAVVLGIAFQDATTEHLREFVEGKMLSYPILRDRPRARTSLGQVPGLPTSFLVDPSGRVVARQVGPVSARGIEDFIAGQERASHE